jgi:DHA1 family bicyclomycin/chloramphenicol resistance-like MFS transporter
MVMPNATALSMSQAHAHAGTASAVLGVTTFLSGAIITPLSGLGDPAISMTVIMLVAAACALVVVFVLKRRIPLDED